MSSFEFDQRERLRWTALRQIDQAHPLHELPQDTNQHVFVGFVRRNTNAHDALGQGRFHHLACTAVEQNQHTGSEDVDQFLAQ